MKYLFSFFAFFLFVLFPLSAFAQDVSVDLVLFYGEGCPHCANARAFLDEFKEEYPELNVIEYEVYADVENRTIFTDLCAAAGEPVMGVPTIFVGDKVFVGFDNSIEAQLEETVASCIEQSCESPLTLLEETEEEGEQASDEEGSEDEEEEETVIGWQEQVTIPAVITAAIVDAINPCAFAVLIILITSILAAGSRKRALFAGLAFVTSIFISYYAMGLGLFSAIQAAGLTRGFYFVVAVLAILIGVFNLKDYLWYGKWFTMEVPQSWRPAMKGLIRGVTSVPGAFLIGFVISLFLLPCTSGPYIVILGMLAESTTHSTALLLLVLYNLIFVSPMLIITLAVYFGFTSVEKAEEWRKKRIKLLHLIAGIIMLLLGACMMIAIATGQI